MSKDTKEEWEDILAAWKELNKLGKELSKISLSLKGYQQRELDSVREDIDNFKKNRLTKKGV